MDKTLQHPKSVGAFLSPEEVNKIAKTVYSRYYYETGLPQYTESAKTQLLMKKRVREALDALAVNGYKVIPNEAEVSREFLTPYAVKET